MSAKRTWLAAALAAAVLILAAVATGLANGPKRSQGLRKLSHANGHAQALAIARERLEKGGEAGPVGPADEDYGNRAYPATAIAITETEHAHQAFQQVAGHPSGHGSAWQEVGPKTPFVTAPATYTGRPTIVSGRVTALAVSPKCHGEDCTVFVGAAGGGVWAAPNGLAPKPNWKPANDGIPTNAIGSIFFDPNDSKARTLYVGTGEPNGSGDSEAGVGLYRSTDGGKSWSLVGGSHGVSLNRAIAAVAIEPGNPNHIWIGTAVARHGSSSSNGGRFTPPNAPKIGLYESTDGGQSFKLVFSVTSDDVNPTTPNGSDFFRGGVSNIQYDTLSKRIYFSVFDYGLYRGTTASGYEQVFQSAGGGDVANSITSRTEFALAPLKTGKLRIYLGDIGGDIAHLYRTDDANVAAASIVWTKLPAGDDYCSNQCSYDMPVASPSGRPDEVWIGGQMQYDEIGGASNGRTVQRSTDAGQTFTDMTNDAQSPPEGMHPDQHAIAFASDPGVAFLGSDGGVVRTNGEFVDASSDCDTRGLSPAELAACKVWLKSIPKLIVNLNDGLATLQFQSVSVNPANPLRDLLGGTQDNGTWAFDGKDIFESVGGDGGQSGIDAGNANIRMHTYFEASPDVNFRKNDPLGWNWIGDPLFEVEPQSFYIPLIADPKVSQTYFAGLNYVWRTTDSGGPQADLEKHCNEFTGDFPQGYTCGDWVRLGTVADGNGLGNGAFWGSDKAAGGYVVATERAPSDTGTLWVGTRRGRVFVSKNADAKSESAVVFTRIDTSSQPTRFVSGIAIDPAHPNHAFLSYSGYNAYAAAAGTAPGHVFEATYDPVAKTTTWKNLDYNLGDEPITDIALDAKTGDLFASTDFGVATLKKGTTTWVPAAAGLPPVATYGLTIDSNARVLYAATHGRGVWKLDLSK